MAHLDTKVVPAGDRFDIDYMHSAGLSLRVRGGVIVDPVFGFIRAPNKTLALAASESNFIEAADDGVVSSNTTSFTASSTPLYVVTTGATQVSGVEDWRGGSRPSRVQALTASGAIQADADFVTLSSTTPLIAATIAAPRPGRFLVITQIDGGTAGHTVTLTAGTWNGSATIATLNAGGETLVVYGVTATRFVIVENIGAVGLT